MESERVRESASRVALGTIASSGNLQGATPGRDDFRNLSFNTLHEFEIQRAALACAVRANPLYFRQCNDVRAVFDWYVSPKRHKFSMWIKENCAWQYSMPFAECRLSEREICYANHVYTRLNRRTQSSVSLNCTLLRNVLSRHLCKMARN